MVEELTESVKETIKSAARKLTGFRRRQFQAEMAIKYCQGHARRTEEVFGWGRDAVNTGLNELRTGFPVELPQRLIELYTFKDDLVLDPFLGSGSTPDRRGATGTGVIDSCVGRTGEPS